MPIFEYVCTKCGNRFEKLTKGDALQEIACPKCHSGEVNKALSPFASTSTSSSGDGCGSGSGGG